MAEMARAMRLEGLGMEPCCRTVLGQVRAERSGGKRVRQGVMEIEMDIDSK